MVQIVDMRNDHRIRAQIQHLLYRAHLGGEGLGMDGKAARLGQADKGVGRAQIEGAVLDIQDQMRHPRRIKHFDQPDIGRGKPKRGLTGHRVIP